MAWLAEDHPAYVMTDVRRTRIRALAEKYLGAAALQRRLQFADPEQVRLVEYSYAVRRKDTVQVEAEDGDEAREVALAQAVDDADDLEIEDVMTLGG